MLRQRSALIKTACGAAMLVTRADGSVDHTDSQTHSKDYQPEAFSPTKN
jgi:hypothetical protein